MFLAARLRCASLKPFDELAAFTLEGSIQILRYKHFLPTVLILLASGGGSRSEMSTSTSRRESATLAMEEVGSTRNYIGFFNPSGTPPELVGKMSFGAINAQSPKQVEASLAAAAGTKFKVRIDFSQLLLSRKSASEIRRTYTTPAGLHGTKTFKPLANVKLFDLLSNAEISAVMASYVPILSKHKANLGVVFLADEPYLNGISKSEMERVIRVVRSVFQANGLRTVPIGVNFSSGMFDPDFAKFIDRESGKYVQNIDAYYKKGRAALGGTFKDQSFERNEFLKWTAIIHTDRLVTYDAAGNMYTGGGIPAGADVVGFDFYLSTILLDGIYEDTLSWFASHYPEAGCAQFAGMPISRIRASLSFFRDGSAPGGAPAQQSDRKLLDSVYQCRMEATLRMLEKAAAGRPGIRFQLFSEASSNGARNFDAELAPRKDQPNSLVEKRVLDEVIRAERFYSAHRNELQCGITFFIYNDAFDSGLNLQVSGASRLPSVIRSVTSFAAEAAKPTPQRCE